MTIALDDLRYPVGRFTPSAAASARQLAIAEIAAMPARLREAVADLGDSQLDTAYRPGAGRCGRWCIMSPTAT